ncbi:MAG TPA: hypothetical protein PLM79_02385 [Syntrophobacteraceae bacterium]|nr:hypothetical protein [Syntrophobacteraceae bacterium]
MVRSGLSPEMTAFLDYTVSHFEEIARRNRFPENNQVEHEEGRCVVCRPHLVAMEPFAAYLEVVARSVIVRRPTLDQGLVDEINHDSILAGLPLRVSVESILAGEGESLRGWSRWVREALDTGLGLLSIHSPTSREFSLEEAEQKGFGGLIEEMVREIMALQKRNRTGDSRSLAG